MARPRATAAPSHGRHQYAGSAKEEGQEFGKRGVAPVESLVQNSSSRVEELSGSRPKLKKVGFQRIVITSKYFELVMR